MFLYSLLVSLFVILCLIMVLLILVQKSKGSIGIGGLGGGSQMLFGGSGGQDLFQKTTWVMGSIFMFGSLLLAIMKSSSLQSSRYFGSQRPSMPMAQQPVEQAPVETPAPAEPVQQ